MRSLGAKTERVRLWLKGMAVAWLKTFWPSRYGDVDGFPIIVPLWVLEALQEASTYEPALAPEQLLPYMRRIEIPASALSTGAAYARLWRNLDHDACKVFVLGDSDGLPSTHVLQAVRRLASNERHHVVVIWTGADSTSFDDEMEGAEFQYLQKISGTRNRMHQTIALGRALLEIQPATIFMASSDVGWAILQTQAVALSHYSTLFAELPNVERERGGERATAAEISLVSGLPASVRLMAGSDQSKKVWIENIGLDPKAIHVAPWRLSDKSEVGVSE